MAIAATQPSLSACYIDTDEQDSITYHGNGVVEATKGGEGLRMGIGVRPSEDSPQQARDMAQATKGRIVILDGGLPPPAGARLAKRIDAIRSAGGPPIFVAAVPVAEGESLERLGWAVRNPTSGSRTLLIDTTSKQVRIMGDMPVEQKAAVTRAMQPDLAAGRLEQAIALGIERLAS
ncbi:hypothetical protein [Sphingomonas swuensis]|uniref:hypothetical protein n=1 Tax=Sphingomonas swuensis TaxID=977800 RepID=UPI0031D165F9